MASCASEPRRLADRDGLADLDRLHGRDAHQGLGEQAVEAAVPVGVAAEPDGDAVADDLGDATERVPSLAAALISPTIASSASRRNSGPPRRRRRRDPRDAAARRAAPRPADRDDVAHDRHAELRKERLGERARRDTGRGLAGRRPLEHVAGVGEAVLLHPGEVGVARAWRGEDRRRLAGLGRHLPLPFRPLGVRDLDRDRRAERPAVTHAADDDDLVALDAHAGAPPVAEPPSGELDADLVDRERQPGGQALDDDDERTTVGFPGREEAEHW